MKPWFCLPFVALAVGCGAAPEPLILELGHIGVQGSLLEKTADEFALRVAEVSGGTIVIEVLGDGSAGDEEFMLQKLKQGNLDLALASGALSSAIPAFGLFDLPYLVRNREDLARLEEEMFWTELAPAAESSGFRVLAIWEYGTQHISTRQRVVRTPDDLVGLRLGMPRSLRRVTWFRELGALPEAGPFQEQVEALHGGALDGQENPLVQIHAADLSSSQGRVSLTGHLYSPAFLTTGRSRWNRLDPDVQALLSSVARELQLYAFEQGMRMEREARQALVDAGVLFTEPDQNAFRVAGGTLHEAYARDFAEGARLLGLARASIAPGRSDN